MSCESLLVLGFTALLAGDKAAWRTHPWLMGSVVLAYLIGLQPGLDAAARHSVALHSLQSALIHHVAPLLLLLAGAKLAWWSRHWLPMAQRLQASPWCVAAVALSFALMSVLWVLPGLHLRLMADAGFYDAMKWGMALTGVLLCGAMAPGRPRWALGLRLAVALPQAASGLYLMGVPPRYLMPFCTEAGAGWSGTLLHWAAGLDPRLDQYWGGALLLLSAVAFVAADALRHPGRISFLFFLKGCHEKS